MWCGRPTSSFVDSSPEVRGQGREVRGWGSRDKIFELDLWTLNLKALPGWSSTYAYPWCCCSFGQSQSRPRHFHFRLSPFAFRLCFTLGIWFGFVDQCRCRIAAWGMSRSVSSGSIANCQQEIRICLIPQKRSVRGTGSWNRRRRKGGLKGEKIDARERSTVCIGSCLIFRCATWFLSFFDNSNEMVKQSSCSCDLKKWQMSDVRCQMLRTGEEREERRERGSSMTDLMAIISIIQTINGQSWQV